ncbi:hypothetical protein BC830DRAFT_311770 [Chytriomyces sp. MP71]|nr:hypothetical protein BC830DRAFT_311770 [Chytriomyces sp. MP71]
MSSCISWLSRYGGNMKSACSKKNQRPIMMPGMMSMMPGAAGSRPYAPQMVSMQPGMMMQSGMNMMMRPMQPQMMRPPGPMYGGGPPVKGLQPYVNSYAARLKDGASTLLMPPVGTLVVGKRKRATRVDTDALREDLDNELGSLSNSEADGISLT